MAMPLKQVMVEALLLHPAEQKMLIQSLVTNSDYDPDETPAGIAAAWETEIARRVGAMERGEVEWIPAEQVYAEIDAMLRQAKT